MSMGRKEPHQKKNDERENAGHISNSQEEATGDLRQTVGALHDDMIREILMKLPPKNVLGIGGALHDDMIREILVKLPPKNVAQLRCLSKAWSAMIDDLYFVRLHHRLWRQNSSNNEVLFQDSDRLYSFCLDSAFDVSYHIEARPVFCGPTQNGVHSIVGSYRGIVFVSKSDCSGYAAWNPLTGELVDIPDIQFPIRLNAYSLYHRRTYCGYDETHQDFKLVRMACYKLKNDDVRRRRRFALAVYSLKNSSWGEIQQLFFEVIPFAADFIDGTNALHFAAEVGRGNLPCIAAYDLGTEVLSFLPLPHGLDGHVAFHGLFSLDGLLSFCELPQIASDCNVWVMGKYGDAKSWRKLFCIQVCYLDFKVIDYSGNRKHVLVWNGGMMQRVEIDTQTIRDAAEILVPSVPSAHLMIRKPIAFQPTLYRIR